MWIILEILYPLQELMAMLNINKNIPNIITIFRIFLVLPIIILFLVPGLDQTIYSCIIDNFIIEIKLNYIIILSIFIIASGSDFADGYIARKYNLISNFGKIFDPIADKILINIILIILATQNKVILVIVLLFIMRDVFMEGVRINAISKNIIIPANIYGKTKTLLQVLGIIFILLISSKDSNDWWYYAIQNFLMYISLIASFLSAGIYFKNFSKLLKDNIKI